MSKSRRLLALAATVTAVAAVPATSAEAHGTPSVKDVQTHAAKADKALTRLHNAVDANKPSVAAKQLRIARSESAAASKQARRMAKGANGAAATKAARGLTIAGEQYDQLVETLANLVDQIHGQVQGAIANALQPSLAGRQKIVDMLNSLMEVVPEQAKPVLASIITALTAGDSTEVTSLDNALDTPGLPVNISAIIQSALDTAVAAINTGFETIKGILPSLPAAVAGPLGTILDTVQGVIGDVVGTVIPSVLQTVTGLVDTVLGCLPFAGAAAGGTGLGALFGGLLKPGKGAAGEPGEAGQSLIPGLGNFQNMISGLLGTATNTATSVIGTVSNLISGLLGNILGGFGPKAPAAT